MKGTLMVSKRIAVLAATRAFPGSVAQVSVVHASASTHAGNYQSGLMDSNSPGQKRRHRHFWTKLVTIVALVGALGFLRRMRNQFMQRPRILQRSHQSTRSKGALPRIIQRPVKRPLRLTKLSSPRNM